MPDQGKYGMMLRTSEKPKEAIQKLCHMPMGRGTQKSIVFFVALRDFIGNMAALSAMFVGIDGRNKDIPLVKVSIYPLRIDIIALN